MKADLHCHTTSSDGTDSPIEIIDRAISLGLSALSITDHDTIDAYQTAAPYANSKSFLLLPGVEFSTMHRNESIHILAYSFSLDSVPIIAFCKHQQTIRHERNLEMAQKLKKLGCEVSEEQMTSTPSFGRPHFAKILIDKGFVSSYEEAFKKYLGEGKMAYVPGKRVTAEEAITAIKEGGGFAVLAHPHLIIRGRVLKTLLELPFDGIECYYARMPKTRNEPFLKIAREKNWLITGGSDFHGSAKPASVLGSSWVGKEELEKLYRKTL